MYRAITLFAMRNHLIDNSHFDKEELVFKLSEIEIRFVFNKNLGFAEVYLNGDNVEKQIRTLEVSNFVSQVATIPEVRHQMVKQQQQMGKDKGVVIDGRDIGTVVFPNAELKIFMTASSRTRAKRRYQELINRGDEVNFEDVLNNIQERDYIDSNRNDSPLMKAEDAIEIDNSDLSLDEQLQKILQLVISTIENHE